MRFGRQGVRKEDLTAALITMALFQQASWFFRLLISVMGLNASTVELLLRMAVFLPKGILPARKLSGIDPLPLLQHLPEYLLEKTPSLSIRGKAGHHDHPCAVGVYFFVPAVRMLPGLYRL